MIKVTRINDSARDTITSLTAGKKVMVRGPIDQVIARVASFKSMSVARVQTPDPDHVAKEG